MKNEKTLKMTTTVLISLLLAVLVLLCLVTTTSGVTYADFIPGLSKVYPSAVDLSNTV